MKGKESTLVGATVALVVYTMFLSMLSPVLSALQPRITVPNTGTVEAVGVGVYWDYDCTSPVDSIAWGTLDPGSNKSFTCYIRNEGTSASTLGLDESNWSPSNGEEYITLSWDYGGETTDPDQVIEVAFTLSVSASIEGVTTFSFDVTILGNEIEPFTEPPTEPPVGATWRPFADTSIWNTKIPYDAPLHPNNDQMISWFQKDSSVWINMHTWTSPIYYTDASTPRYDVRDTGPWGKGGMANVPLPDGHESDRTSDAHLCVVALDEQVSYDFYRYDYSGAGLYTSWVAMKWDLTGNADDYPNGYGGSRAAGPPLIAGMITKKDIEQGVIEHALYFAMGGGAGSGGWIYPPATLTDGYDGSTYAIPEGARLRLNPDLNLDTLGLSPAGKIIAKCLQDYGMFLVDNSGGTCLYAEADKTAHWGGILSGGAISGIPGYEWQVVAYGVPGVTGTWQPW